MKMQQWTKEEKRRQSERQYNEENRRSQFRHVTKKSNLLIEGHKKWAKAHNPIEAFSNLKQERIGNSKLKGFPSQNINRTVWGVGRFPKVHEGIFGNCQTFSRSSVV
jgi:hypothetical protein